MSTPARVGLPDGWALWRWFVLRGAGFPADGVLSLASPERARAVEALLDAEDALRRASDRALDECLKMQPEVSPEEQRPLQRAIRALRRGRLSPEPAVSLGATLDEVFRATADVDSARTALHTADVAAGIRERAAIREVARGRLFREAVTWQNRGAVQRGIESLLRRPADASDFKTRQNERLVVSYLQRYCTKNDTIGFFGPVGWGRFEADGPAIVMTPGPTLLARRTVYFEHWAIEALAELLARDPAIRRWAAPRMMPTLRIEGDLLLGAGDRAMTLSSSERALLRACDGQRSAVAVAALLIEDPRHGFLRPEEVFAALEPMAQRGWITWTVELPTGTTRPERILRSLLEGIGDQGARARGLAVLDALERCRDEAARAGGDPEAVGAALAALETEFTIATGLEATKHAGRTYAGRTLVYEDCARDLDLRVGPEMVQRIGPTLALCLTSARWYTYEIATRYGAVLGSTWRELAARTRSSAIDLARFRNVMADQRAVLDRIVREVQGLLQAKWATLLGLGDGDDEAPVDRAAESLHSGAAAAFAAPHPGWPTARHSSPDILIAARDVDAIRRGEYVVVLGELHVGVNTCMNGLFLGQHHAPAELVEAYEADVAPTIDVVLPASVRGHRTKNLAQAPHDVSLEHDATRAWRERGRVLAIADLFVVAEDGFLRVRRRGGEEVFDVLDVFQEDLMLASRHLFHPFAVGRHGRRVTIGGMVVRRRRWTFEPAECAFALAEEVLHRFVGARRWARTHGLPRFVFAKIPEEPKPCYLDLESGPFVDLLAKMVRGASQLTLSEMLPALDETWLRDGEGRAYVSELRMAAVDPEAWRPRPMLTNLGASG